MELFLELKGFRGECWDNTVEFTELSKSVVQDIVFGFMEGYFDEGYSEFNPQYFLVSDSDYDQLIGGSPVYISGHLKIELEGV